MEPRFYHFQFLGGRITAASVMKDDKIFVALAFCSPYDQFNRRLGRTISTGRLRKKKYHLVFDKEGFSKDALIAAIKQAAENKEKFVPQWITNPEPPKRPAKMDNIKRGY